MRPVLAALIALPLAPSFGELRAEGEYGGEMRCT